MAAILSRQRWVKNIMCHEFVAFFMSDLDDRQYYVIRDVTDILIYDGEYGNYHAKSGYLQKELFIIVNSVLIPVGQERVEMRISWGYQMYKKLIYCNYLSWMLWSSFFSCDQAAQQMVFSVCLSVCPSVRPSVCLSHLFHHVPIIVSSWNFQELLPWSRVMSMQKVKVRGQRSRSQRSTPNLAVSGL